MAHFCIFVIFDPSSVRLYIRPFSSTTNPTMGVRVAVFGDGRADATPTNAAESIIMPRTMTEIPRAVLQLDVQPHPVLLDVELGPVHAERLADLPGFGDGEPLLPCPVLPQFFQKP
jgi:hypothetical protein